jgi:hypothetical protein
MSDSKDFLEQVRTVHFTLLAVCLTAVVIVSSPSPTRIIKVNEQLSGIVAVKEGWRSNWLETSAEELSRQHGECLDPQNSPYPQHMMIGQWQFEAIIKRRWDVKYRVADEQVASGDTTSPAIPAPDNLREFRDLWNSSGELWCPSEGVLARTGDKAVLWDPKYHNFGPPQGLSGPHLEILPPRQMKDLKPKEFVWALTQNLGQGPDNGIEKRPPVALIQISNDAWQWAIFTTVAPKNVGPIAIRSQIMKAFPGYAWQSNDFENVFPELDQVAKERQLFDVRFDHLRTNLISEESAAKEPFQVFGIKFPIEGTTRWAVLLILAIQGYLWLHLNEYWRRGAPKTDVAWIAVYPGLAPKVVSALTMLVVPVLVVVLLCVRQGLMPLKPMANTILASLACTLSVFLAVLTAITYRLVSIVQEGPARPDQESNAH